jgi:sulfur carrier protein
MDGGSCNNRPLMIRVTINGEARQFEQTLRFGELVERLGLTGKRIAVERNGEIVPRSQFSAHSLADGDRLEIVVAVGGG